MSMKLTLLIADDEEHVCMELRYMLDKCTDIEVVKTCADGDEALEAIVSLKPDVVFLDIAMPGLNGIQLGHILKTTGHTPYITYITAYENHAVAAFKVGAKGYILKPFSQADIEDQITRARDYLERVKPPSTAPMEVPYVALETNGKFVLVAQSDIIMAFANDRAVFLRVGPNEHPCGYSLAELELMLQSQHFFRCHRNFIVNIHHIREIQPWFHGTYQLLMDDNTTQVPVSRSKVKELRNKFKI